MNTVWTLLIALSSGMITIPDIRTEAECRTLAEQIRVFKPEGRFVCIGQTKVVL